MFMLKLSKNANWKTVLRILAESRTTAVETIVRPTDTRLIIIGSGFYAGFLFTNIIWTFQIIAYQIRICLVN